MSLPQFTGQASLYSSSKQYLMMAGAPVRAGSVAIPQLNSLRTLH